MKHLKIIFSIVFISGLFILNGCSSGSGGGGGPAGVSSPTPSPIGATVPVITAFSLNDQSGVITNNNIAVVEPYGTDITRLVEIFTAPGSIVTINGIPQISGVTVNDFTHPIVYTVTSIGENKSISAKASVITRTYTVTVTVASPTAKSITAFSLKTSTSTTITSGIISNLNIAVIMPFGTDVTALTATFTSSGAKVTVNGDIQKNGLAHDFTNPVIYKVTAANGTSQNYKVTVTVALASANNMIAFSLEGTPGIISQGGLSQEIIVKVPFGTNLNGLVATFITTGVNVLVNEAPQISGTTIIDFTKLVTYIVTAADGTTQTYTIVIIVSSKTSNFINDFSFGNISGVISGQDIALTVPFGTDITDLIAIFTTTGVNVIVDGIDQTSTLTTNNFTNPVKYTVIAADGVSTLDYIVTVTVAPASAKAITEFAFGLTHGIITGESIAVIMPFGTNITDLIADFNTSGVKVSVGTLPQVSGSTRNDFTNPVPYIVTAADKSTATYTVTVTVAASSAKAIIEYSIAGEPGTFTAGEPGTFTDFNIEVKVPFGMSLQTVADFTSTGASVNVNGVPQFTGTTTVNFTNPVEYLITAADGSTAKYKVTVTYINNVWRWLSGSNIGSQSGTYGTTPGIGSITNIPGGRENGVLQFISGSAWLFGGSGLGTGDSGVLNDLWQYSPLTKEWTWMGGSNTANRPGTYGTPGIGSVDNMPGGRERIVSWSDSAGNLWIFGGSGRGTGATVGNLNDLWKYSISGPSAGQWTWVSGSNTINKNGIYSGTDSTTYTPGARQDAYSWTDSSGNFWLFGGRGYAASGGFGSLNDLWKYTPSTNQWTWVSGANSINQASTYGIKGTTSSSNMPGARYGGAVWVDSSDNLWLFGGFGGLYLNDLWKYSTSGPSAGQWTWVSGTSSFNQNGTYGIQGTASTNNFPGGRLAPATWVDSSGNFWLFAGYGLAVSGGSYFLSDLWRYDPTTNEWTWMSGPNINGQNGIYGTKGIGTINNTPGSRSGGRYAWSDGNGDLWVFGGVGFDGASRSIQFLNDLWQYHY